jgi:uncharacterized protein DUF4194
MIESTIDTTNGVVVAHGGADEHAATGLWPGDTGVLSEGSRRALLRLIKGPYLSGQDTSGLWSALLADERAIRSRLHELFLDLVIDTTGEFAFVRNVSTDDLSTPATVRTETLTFMDTAMLLVLRQALLTADTDGRVIVGKDEVFEQLRVYRTPDRDEHDFDKRMNSSWLKMRNTLRLVHSAARAGEDEDRVEISPVVRLLVDPEQVRAISAEYAKIAGHPDAAGPAENNAENMELEDSR